MANTKYPFGSSDVQVITGTGTKAVAISDNFTILNLSTITGAITLNLTFDQSIQVGARIVIHVVQDGTGQDVVLGTGFAASAVDLTGVANDEDLLELYYNGTSMIPFTAAWAKIVDAA